MLTRTTLHRSAPACRSAERAGQPWPSLPTRAGPVDPRPAPRSFTLALSPALPEVSARIPDEPFSPPCSSAGRAPADDAGCRPHPPAGSRLQGQVTAHGVDEPVHALLVGQLGGGHHATGHDLFAVAQGQRAPPSGRIWVDTAKVAWKASNSILMDFSMIVYPLLHENRPRTSAQPQHGERWQLSCQPHGKLKPFKINSL